MLLLSFCDNATMLFLLTYPLIKRLKLA